MHKAKHEFWPSSPSTFFDSNKLRPKTMHSKPQKIFCFTKINYWPTSGGFTPKHGPPLFMASSGWFLTVNHFDPSLWISCIRSYVQCVWWKNNWIPLKWKVKNWKTFERPSSPLVFALEWTLWCLFCKEFYVRAFWGFSWIFKFWLILLQEIFYRTTF